MSPGLSKSKLLSFRQCPRRLWLERHRPELAEVTPGQEAAFELGHEVGDVARRLYDTGGGILIELDGDLRAAMERTNEVLARRSAAPVFEATFQRNGLLVRVDVLERGAGGWRLIEVKASASVKPEHLEDCAIQSWVLQATPARPRSVSLAHVDSRFLYPGDDRYEGLLAEHDLSAKVVPLHEVVPAWVRSARQILAGDEPAAAIGSRCRTPYDCPFQGHCWRPTEYPLTGLPRLGTRLDALLAEGLYDIRELEERHLATEDQRRVWRAVRSGRAELPAAAAVRTELESLGHPHCYLDFETVSLAVPRWPGTHPYQPLPFQFSVHVESRDGGLHHAQYLDLGGGNPVRRVAEALLEATRGRGPVFTYTPFEQRCIATLAEFCPDLRERLESLAARLVDLHPIVKRHYYHPAMQGSWSIKSVLPTIAPELDYAGLGEVQEGGAAQQAWLEAIHPDTAAARRAELRDDLLAYCRQDTLAMVTLARFLEGRD